MPSPPTPYRCAHVVLLFAGVGFLAGYVGPIILNPGANQGPLLGLFITGPLGVLIGALACLLQRLVPVIGRRTLQVVAAALALVTLYYCLPEPALVGRVLEARVAACAAPREFSGAALARWQEAVARTSWAHPPADWKQAALRNVAAFDAVVLTLDVARSRAIYAERRPWNRGRRFAAAWTEVDAQQTYFARGAGELCSGYLAREPALYWPVAETAGVPGQPGPWPPTDAPGFLSLQELGPLPPEVRALID